MLDAHSLLPPDVSTCGTSFAVGIRHRAAHSTGRLSTKETARVSRKRFPHPLAGLLAANPAQTVAYPPEHPSGRDEFMRLLDNLPESQREVIFMLKVSGMSLEEVARATSSTVGAIKQKAHRAYERLRLTLDRKRKTQ
jgi:DNA-directed RNA polymerase specialized sigma24 family protein